MTKDRLFFIGVSDRLSPTFWDGLSSFYERTLPILQKSWCSGFVVLKTCQRFEIYGTTQETLPLETIHQLFSSHFPGYLFLKDAEVVRHLFRVTAGLESALFGEVHILGQVKRAWEQAWQERHTSKILNVLFQRAIRVGKKLRKHLPGEERCSSFGAFVVELLKREALLSPKSTVTILGWGMLGRSIAGALRACGVQRIFVYTRHQEHVPKDPCFTAIPEEGKLWALSRSQVVVCAARAPRYAITQDTLCSCSSIPRVLIDLAMPPNIDPQVSCLVGKLYTLEDILKLAREHTLPLVKDLALFESLVEEEVSRFMRTLKGFDADPLLRRVLPLLREVFEEEKRNIPYRLPSEKQETFTQLLNRLCEKTTRKTAESIRGFFEER